MIQVDTLDEMFDVAQLLAHQPLPRGPPGGDRRQLRRPRPAGRRRRRRPSAWSSTGPSRWAPTPTAEDFEDALDAAIDDPDVDAVVAVYVPPLNVSGEDVANVLAAVGEQSDKPIVSSFLGAEGVPELLRVPDVAGRSAGRGSVPSYPAVEAAVRALARVVGYAVWLRTPNGPAADARRRRPGAAQAVRQPSCSSQHPDGRDLDHDELRTPARGLRHRPVGADAGRRRSRRRSRAGRELGWDVVLKATADRLRERPDLAHVWRNIDNPAEMRDAWEPSTS